MIADRLLQMIHTLENLDCTRTLLLRMALRRIRSVKVTACTGRDAAVMKISAVEESGSGRAIAEDSE
jgi:hypothetical protein